jgi:hypothetical protein
MSAVLPVNRVQRRRMILQSRGAPIEFGQLPQEARSRVARKVRCYLMQLRAVALVAPRWSDPSTFLQEIADDLFPAIRCQIISARSMVGRTEREAWNFLLHALNHLSFEGADTRPVPMVIDERGFETAVEQALYLASQEDIPTALVIQNAEHLPVQTLEMLGRKWVSQQTFNRCTLLVSASVATPALSLTEGPWIELEDFTEQESIRRLQQRSGTAPQELIRSAARFSGGIPSLVDVIADSLRQNRWPTSRGGWIEVLGEFTEELKAADWRTGDSGRWSRGIARCCSPDSSAGCGRAALPAYRFAPRRSRRWRACWSRAPIPRSPRRPTGAASGYALCHLMGRGQRKRKR